MMHRVAEAYKRWRHTRGYGVHSPFAFRMVGRVIRMPRGYRYYRESAPDALNNMERRYARLLLRLVAELDIRSAVFAPGFSVDFIEIFRGFRSEMEVSSGESFGRIPHLILGLSSRLDLKVYLKALQSPHLKAIWIKCPPAEWDSSLFDSMSEGVMFRGKNSILIIPHSGMQKVAYSVCI